MNLGRSLKVALALEDMMNKTLAEKLGTSPQQISNWIGSGDIGKDSLIKICQIFNMPVSEFIALGED